MAREDYELTLFDRVEKMRAINELKDIVNNGYQCLHIFKPVYDEYIRIGYRLKYYPHERRNK